MKIIIEADNVISATWGEKIIHQGSYCLMNYLIIEDISEGKLMHNMVTGEMILLDKTEAENLASLPCEYAPWMDELIQKHFLVNVESDNFKAVQALRTALRLIEKTNDINYYTILPTTNCNARCFYCFESEINRVNMTDETADKLVKFMDEHHGNKPVSITWFGGEPLLGSHQIDRISSSLNEKNIAFSSRIITNGYLWNEVLIEKAKKLWNLKGAQITLDGTEKVYNQTKAYVNVEDNPYFRVLENIRLLLKNEIKVNIRLNLGRHNANDLEILIKELAVRFPQKENLYIYVRTLTDDCGFNPAYFTNEENIYLIEVQNKLEELIDELGFPFSIKPPKIKINHCVADNDSCVIVSPAGKLAKCEHSIDNTVVGDLDRGIKDFDKIEFFKEAHIPEICKTCFMFPTCIQLKICKPETPCDSEQFAKYSKHAKELLVKYYKHYFKS